MFNLKLFRALGLLALLAVAGFAQSSTAFAQAGDDHRAPDLPPLCDNLQAPQGHIVSAHVYALGVQIYRWNGGSWDFVAPLAKLFADAGYHGVVGTHYAGPTWESNSGSKVVGTHAAPPCFADPASIPWLLLRKVSSEGPGIFSHVTYIQRLNTVGGTAPATPGAFTGAEARVPYTAEYFFYRAEN